ncbi:hypothetical protein N0V86_005359 [Didymella sp. IMI 355093]|nr:hypothetical protein N0V86_005359 [Didymella sp. IMI 355093]
MSVVVRTAQDVVGNVSARIEHATNRILPTKQREHALENLRAFSVRNPKLATFLTAEAALAGFPILLFLAFATATLVVSVITCVLLGVIAALAFTLFTTGFALLFVVPIVFIGSCTASLVFVWSLIGYLVLQRINGGETPIQPGTKLIEQIQTRSKNNWRWIRHKIKKYPREASTDITRQVVVPHVDDMTGETTGLLTVDTVENLEKRVKRVGRQVPRLERDILAKEREIIQRLT